MAKLELSEKRQAFVKKAEEYYNALRTNIQLSGDKLKVIAVSSVRPGEGKCLGFCACWLQNTPY